MLELNKNQKRLPIGGHHYAEYGVTFKGETFAEVVADVEKFRVNNCITIGNPEQDVLFFYMKHWPYMVVEVVGVSGKPSSKYENWRSWIQKTWKNPPQKTLVPKEAQERWDVCKGCKFNEIMNWEQTDESKEMMRRSFLLRRGVDVPKKIGYCSRHRCDLPFFVFIEEADKFSAKSKDCEAFAGCWIK